jgi:thioredoxin
MTGIHPSHNALFSGLRVDNVHRPPITRLCRGRSVAIDAEHYLQEGQDMTLKAVTDATFNIEVLMNDKPVLVHFWATWSGPSRMNTPILQEVANQYPDTLSVVQLDVDANPVTPRTYGIMQIPTMNLYRDSEVVRQIVGTLPKTALLADLAGYI